MKIIGDVPIFVAARLGRRVGQPGPVPARRGPPADGRRRACRRTTSAPTASTGATRSTTGRGWRRPATRGGSPASARQLEQVDLVRLDHFRGFAQAWHIPAGEKTAPQRASGWTAPGAKLFERLRTALGGLPLIAEDLGLITPDVIALRDQLGLPGMRVLQFALERPADTCTGRTTSSPNSACYTGTHDNDTSNGWYATLDENERHYLAHYARAQTSATRRGS